MIASRSWRFSAFMCASTSARRRSRAAVSIDMTRPPGSGSYVDDTGTERVYLRQAAREAMTSTSSNDLVERVRRVYERFASGDPQPMIELLDEAVIYHLPGKHLGGGTLRGRHALFERTGNAAAACDAPPRIVLLHVGAADP